MVSLIDLTLPVVLTAIALFFASFLSWMVLQLHKADWRRLPAENAAMAEVAKWNLPVGSYMFPYCDNPEQMKNPEFQKKYTEGPRGILQILPPSNMGLNLGLTFLYFLTIAYVLGYLASVAFPKGETFMNVFRFTFTAGLFIFVASMLQQSIWFKNRLTGHAIESLAYAAIAAGLFAALWPAA